MMNSTNSSTRTRPQKGTNNGAYSRATNTPSGFIQCPHCNQTFKSNASNSAFLKDYMISLKYINKCHGILNHVMRAQNPTTEVTIPELPNFLNVFNYMDPNTNEFIDLNDLKTIDDLLLGLTDSQNANEWSHWVPQIRPQVVHCGVDARSSDVVSVKTNTRRYTGIPRRVTTKTTSLKNMRKPILLMSPKSKYDNVDMSTSTLIEETEGGRPAGDMAPVVEEQEPQQRTKLVTPTITNEELDYYARQLLLVRSNETNNSLCKPTTPDKLEKRKSKDTINKTLQLYLSQLNLKDGKKDAGEGHQQCDVDQPEVKNEVEPEDKEECAGAVCLSPKEPVYTQKPLSTTQTNNETKPMEANPEPYTLPPRNSVPTCASAITMPGNEMSHQEIIFHNFAKSCDDQANFLMNEKPAWGMSNTSTTLHSEQSDIEPDSAADLAYYRQLPQRKLESNVVARDAEGNIILNTDRRRATYLVMRKPQDAFLMVRRRHSHSDVESERETYRECDIDDKVFIKKQRRAAVKHPRAKEFVQPQLSPKIISNIGILTKTGQVRPEKERQIEAMRRKLSSDMQTHLFRKPRNRKVDASDIIRIDTEEED